MTVLIACTAEPPELESSIDAHHAFRSACPVDGQIADPPAFVWTYHPVSANNPEPYYSGVLEIGEASFEIGGETLTTRAYRQPGHAYSIPGPTITVEPGQRYVLRFHNTLPYAPLSSQTNVLKDPDASNVHTHGLHISGEAPGDDLTRSFPGGYGGDFVWDIPADHMGGTYWYHAHHHGSTFLQVSGGAFGLLIVDDGNDGIPDNVAAMTERQLVIAYLDTGAAGAGGDTLLSGTLAPSWTVNGTVGGSLCAPVDEWQHWRVLLADRDARVKTLSIDPDCEVALLARDGVWRTSAPRLLLDNSLDLTGASRADLAVRCSDDAAIRVDNEIVASVRVDGPGDAGVHPWAGDGVSPWSAIRPSYLRDLSGVVDVNSASISMGARTINGAKFDMDVPTYALAADSVQEWGISGAVNHPFHLHVYHMQTFGCSGGFEDGEYYDTVASNCTVRFDLDQATASPYAGRTLMHCHILEHEDRGAMGWVDVLGGTPPPSFPADGDLLEPYALEYPLTAPPAPTEVGVGSIVVSTVQLGQGQRRGRAVVEVVDEFGNGVADAVVSGEFSGSITESIGASEPTDANGLTTIDTVGTAKGNISLSFCVTAIAHDSLADFMAAPGEVCGSL